GYNLFITQGYQDYCNISNTWLGGPAANGDLWMNGGSYAVLNTTFTSNTSSQINAWSGGSLSFIGCFFNLGSGNTINNHQSTVINWMGCGGASGTALLYSGGPLTTQLLGTGSNVALPGSLITRTQYAPSTADTSSTVVSSTGLTSVYFSTGHDQAVTFTAPFSGAVTFRMQAFVKGGAGAATSTVFGIASTTEATSPGTVVGVLGLVQLTPT